MPGQGSQIPEASSCTLCPPPPHTWFCMNACIAPITIILTIIITIILTLILIPTKHKGKPYSKLGNQKLKFCVMYHV